MGDPEPVPREQRSRRRSPQRWHGWEGLRGAGARRTESPPAAGDGIGRWEARGRGREERRRLSETTRWGGGPFRGGGMLLCTSGRSPYCPLRRNLCVIWATHIPSKGVAGHNVRMSVISYDDNGNRYYLRNGRAEPRADRAARDDPGVGRSVDHKNDVCGNYRTPTAAAIQIANFFRRPRSSSACSAFVSCCLTSASLRRCWCSALRLRGTRCCPTRSSSCAPGDGTGGGSDDAGGTDGSTDPPDAGASSSGITQV